MSRVAAEVTLEQRGNGIDEERHQDPVVRGEFERTLQGPFDGRALPGLVTYDRLD